MSDRGAVYQLFDALDPATEAALRASINRWGVIVPVVEDQHGNILDGHHRSRIANELGIEYDRTVMVVDDEAQAVEVAKTLNTDRRHLTIEQRRELVADLRAQGYSLRAIAGAVGVSQETVRNDIGSPVNHLTPEPVSVLGLDGKRYSPTQVARTDSELNKHELSSFDLPEFDPTPKQLADCETKPAVLFTLDELPLLAQLKAGNTIVVNMRDGSHARLWAYAEAQGLAVRIDRKSEWGNPFVLDEDGPRDEVCDLYANVYWPHKISLHAKVSALKGKALGCWCAPERCHGDHLKAQAET